jgi:hypothetical protein
MFSIRNPKSAFRNQYADHAYTKRSVKKEEQQKVVVLL